MASGRSVSAVRRADKRALRAVGWGSRVRYLLHALEDLVSEPQTLPAVTFSSFFITLAQSAMVHLGETADPSSGARAVDMNLARHTIDALGMLAEKTEGNLDDDEVKLVSSLLDELRAKFVEVSRRRG